MNKAKLTPVRIAMIFLFKVYAKNGNTFPPKGKNLEGVAVEDLVKVFAEALCNLSKEKELNLLWVQEPEEKVAEITLVTLSYSRFFEPIGDENLVYEATGHFQHDSLHLLNQKGIPLNGKELNSECEKITEEMNRLLSLVSKEG